MNGSTVFGQPASFDIASLQANFLYKPGIAGGQLAHGGTAAGDELQLQGSTDADRGRIIANGGITVDWNWSTDAIAAGGINIAQVIGSSGGYIGAFITIGNTITVDNALFILSALDDFSTLTWTVNPGFAVETLFFARPTYRSATAGISPAQAFIYAAQAQYRLTGAGNRTVANYRALSFAPIFRVDNAGDELHMTNTTGVIVSPLWNTRNATAVADFGNIRGVHMANAAAVAFGGQSLGSEIATNWIGLDVDSLTTLVVSGRRAAVRSAIPNATNARFLENLSTANTDFGSSNIFFRDAFGVAFGGAYNVADILLRWQAAGYYQMLFTANSDEVRFSNAVNNQILIDFTNSEFTFNTSVGFSLGAQTGTNGNQWGNFVTGARTVQIAGEWSDFLLTHAANLTVDIANMNVYAWTLNSTSITLSGAGTVLTSGILNIGGNPNEGSVNRFGIRVLSNPSGGSGVNAALWITAGLSRFDGRVDINNGIALGGGANATLGTIGGSGPTAAAQAQWVEIDIGGVAHWIAAWT